MSVKATGSPNITRWKSDGNSIIRSISERSERSELNPKLSDVDPVVYDGLRVITMSFRDDSTTLRNSHGHLPCAFPDSFRSSCEFYSL